MFFHIPTHAGLDGLCAIYYLREDSCNLSLQAAANWQHGGPPMNASPEANQDPTYLESAAVPRSSVITGSWSGPAFPSFRWPGTMSDN
jgi:hypothetical protein